MYQINLLPELFAPEKRLIVESDDFSITTQCYPQNIASLTITNSRGHLEILPFFGQMIWDAVFDGHSLKMTNMFAKPQRGKEIVDTYGCFAFHSGLLANGCPSPDDNHPLHGEFPCAEMASASLIIENKKVSVVSEYEYIRGFGHHYRATPSVVLEADRPRFDLKMTVENLSAYQAMPLMYMCHLNYAYVAEGIMGQNIPDEALQLRQTIPAHVKPTPQWQAFNAEILAGKINGNILNHPQCYDPEIVYFADNLSQYGEKMIFELFNPANHLTFSTIFSSREFPHATRWILNHPDQQVCAFVLPATARPEGYLAAEQAGTLMWLSAGESRSFSVNTGIKE